MKLWLDFCLGPFRFTFDPDGELDPQPELEEDADEEREPKGSGWPLDSLAEYGVDTRNAELHGDPDRSWSYDPGDKPRRTGF